MSSHDKDLRLFVAAYPPAEVVHDMLRVLRRLDLPAYRETNVDQVHLTLAFLGDTPERNLPDVTESVARSASGLSEFTLTPARLLTFPQRGRPRLVALETDTPATLLELVRRLATRLARSPRRRADDRFLPHFTLCRFQHSARAESIDRPAAVEPFLIDRIHLMRSTLRSEGAVHDEVESFALEPRAG